MRSLLRTQLIPLLILFGVVSFSSCKDYSSDDPLPASYAPTVFVGNNNKMVYAVDMQSGNVRWKVSVNGEVHATPVFLGNSIWVGTNSGHLYQINTLDGKILYDKDFGAAIEGTPMVYNNNLLVPAGTKLILFNVSSHDLDWSYQMGGAITASPAVHNIAGGETNAIFIAGANGKVVALKDDGSVIWQFTPAGGQAFNSSPCVSNDSFLYIGNDNGKIYSVNTTNGHQKWEFSTLGAVKSSPIQIGGNVLVGSNDRNFYSVDSATGLLRWKIPTEDQIVSSPVVANQYVYFGSYDGFLYKIDIIDGHLIWKQQTFGLIKSSPTYCGGYIYFGSFDQNLYKLDTADGAQSWVRNVNGQMQSSPIVDTLNGVAVPSISGSYPY